MAEPRPDLVSSQVKLFVGNLPFSATNRTLEELFRPYGTLVGVKLVLDRATRRPRGFGFCTFESDEAAGCALELNGHKLNDRVLTVRRAVARGTGSLKDADDDDDDEEEIPLGRPQPMGAQRGPACKFFASPSGCKNGAKCTFGHSSMTAWSGPGGGDSGPARKAPAAKAKAKAAKAKPKASDHSQAPHGALDSSLSSREEPNPAQIVQPPLAMAAAKERQVFLQAKASTDGPPTAPQLGAFLRTVVTSLRSALDDPAASFDMSSIGWSYKHNTCVPGRAPPTPESVSSWLANPVFVPAPEITLEAYQNRATGAVSALLEEYGEFDPTWKQEAEKKNANKSK